MVESHKAAILAALQITDELFKARERAHILLGLVVAVTDLGLLDVEAVDDSNDTGADKSMFSAALDEMKKEVVGE